MRLYIVLEYGHRDIVTCDVFFWFLRLHHIKLMLLPVCYIHVTDDY